MGIAADYRKTVYGRPATVRAKLSLFDNHIAQYARPQAVQGFVDRVMEDWKENKLSMGTIKTLFSILKDFVKFAWKCDIDTKRLKFLHFGDRVKPQNKLKIWSSLEVNAALTDARIKDWDLFCLMTVALETGIRRGELFALTWEDVDILKGEITISKSLDLDTNEVGPTKTKQTRTIHMSTNVAKLLEKCYLPGKEGDRCFKAFNPNQKLKALCKAGGLPVISWHALRHCYATALLEKGVSPKWVSAQLGHAKLSTTFDYYWEVFNKKVNIDGMYD
jgi:integrase